MKSYFTLIILMACLISQAQSPLRINFQGVIRNNDGNLVESENLVLEIGFKASLSSPGFVYRESHNIQTNAYGQVSVQIGNGTILNGTFNAIDWSTGTVTFEAVATINGNNLVVSQQQLSSVPYALFATKAQSLSGPDDIDNTNEIQSLSLTGNTLGISGHPGTVNLSPLLDNTDNQTLSLNNTNLSITGGNSVDLAPLIANVDTSPSNEIQHLSVNGSTLQLSQSLNTINLGPYLGVNTDEQTLSLSGTSLSISNGNAVDLAPLVQDLQLTGNTLSLTNDLTTIDLTPYLQNAVQVPFNNTTSGLNATTVQAALDEVVADKPDDLQEAYSGGATIQLNGADEFRIRNSTAGPILSTSNTISGIGVGVETPLHKIHAEGTTLATTHAGFDALEALWPSTSFETGELHYFTEGDAANHNNIAVSHIMNGTGFNYGSFNMAQSDNAVQNTGSFCFSTGASVNNIGLRAKTEGTNAASQNFGLYSEASGIGQVNAAVRGISGGASLQNTGVVGEASGSATNNYGTRGLTTATGASNYGIFGRANGAGTTNYGVYGNATGGTTNYGVYGTAPFGATNYAGYFNGNVSIVVGGLEVSTISSSGATVSINDNLSITGDLSTTGNITLPNAASLEVTNLASAGSTVNINDNLSTTGNITSSGNISLQGALLKGSTQLIDVKHESVYAGLSAGLVHIDNISAFRNVGIGYGALQDHTSGIDNVAIGSYSLNDNISSDENTAVGSFAANGITTSSGNNVAIGANSLRTITTNSSSNTAIGNSSMRNVTSGIENVAVGNSAMNSSNSAGNYNIAVGSGALTNINNGNSNVVIGRSAGGNIDSESNNVLLGTSANTVGDIQNGVAIGHQATVAQNDAIVLGSVGNANIRVGIGTNTPTEKLHVVGNALITGNITTTSVTETSDRRLKENIKLLEISEVIQIINSIDGYQYTWKADTSNTDKKTQYGVIAQEVERVLPDIVHTDAKGYKSVNYTALVPFLLEAVKSQQQKIEALQKSNDGLHSLLEKELSALAAEVKVLRNEKTVNTEKP